MISSAASSSAASDLRVSDSLAMSSDINPEVKFAPPLAPMAMPKQVLERGAERSASRGASGWLRLPFFGNRVQG